MRLHAALLVLALGTLTFPAIARADVFTMKDGSTLEGAIVGSSDDAYFVRLGDGSTRRVLKSDVKSKEWRDPQAAPATKPQPPTAATPVVVGATLTADERMAALKKTAREGLAARSRLVVGARELTTFVPIKVEGGYALATEPKKLELDQANYLDRTVDELARDLWDKRTRPADERFHALKTVAAAVCWCEAEVVSAVPQGSATEAVIEYRSVVLRGKTRIRTEDADSVKPHSVIKLAVVLLVRQEEGSQFLAGQIGDSVSVWPVDFVPIAAEVTVGGRTPRTVASDLAVRVGERTVYEAVKEWYSIRTRINCSACKGSRKCVCPTCNGAGGQMKQFIDAGGGATTGMYWYPCSRCQGTGYHTCSLCKDGLDEILLKESLRRWGTYGKPLGGFLVEGQKIELDKDAKGALVTTWIRQKPNDQPVQESMRWVFDEKTTSWKPAS
jgi:hypothetical protein